MARDSSDPPSAGNSNWISPPPPLAPVLPRQIPPSPSSCHVQLPFGIVTLFTLQKSNELERFGPTFGGKTVFSFMTYPPCQRLHQIQSLPTLHAPSAILGGY